MLRYEVISGIACITLDNPPVNGLCLALRRAMLAAFQRAGADADVRAVVLSGAGRGFCAGGDIREFGTAAASAYPALSQDVHPAIEALQKPVIAAIHGMAVGGGLETALVCHYRVVESNAKIGLPEVTLGTIPLSGTQRLPRLMPLASAIDFILSGRIVLAETLSDTALFDRIVPPGAALSTAIDLAGRVSGLPLVRARQLFPDDGALASARRALVAEGDVVRQRALDAIEAAYSSPDFDSGLREARAVFARLMESEAVSRARDIFLGKSTPEASQ